MDTGTTAGSESPPLYTSQGFTFDILHAETQDMP